MVDENEGTGEGVHQELEEEAFCDLKAIDDNVKFEEAVVCEVVRKDVKLGIKNDGIC